MRLAQVRLWHRMMHAKIPRFLPHLNSSHLAITLHVYRPPNSKSCPPCSPHASSALSLAPSPANLSPAPPSSGARSHSPPAVPPAHTSPRFPTLPQNVPSPQRETAGRSCSRSAASCQWPRSGPSHVASRSKPNRRPSRHRSSLAHL